MVVTRVVVVVLVGAGSGTVVLDGAATVDEVVVVVACVVGVGALAAPQAATRASSANPAMRRVTPRL